MLLIGKEPECSVKLLHQLFPLSDLLSFSQSLSGDIRAVASTLLVLLLLDTTTKATTLKDGAAATSANAAGAGSTSNDNDDFYSEVSSSR